MRYTFDLFNGDTRLLTTTDVREIETEIRPEHHVKIYDNLANIDLAPVRLNSLEELVDWYTAREMAFAWKPEIKETRTVEHPSEGAVEVPGKEEPGLRFVEDAVKDGSGQSITEAVNPAHYKSFIPDIRPGDEALEWLETMQYRYAPEVFIGAVDLQIRKYMDRNGNKDHPLQEYQKGLWYYKFLVAFMKNGNKPIRVRDIDNLLAVKS